MISKNAVFKAVIFATAVASVLLLNNPSIKRSIRHEVLISIVGDVMLDRGVANKIAQNGPSYPFEIVSRVFKEDDLTIANLECPLTSGGVGTADKEIVFKADPNSAVALKSAGFDALMLANNHAMDYLGAGLFDTINAFDSAELLYAGAAKSAEEIHPLFINKNGIRIGILSYNALAPEEKATDGGGAIAYALDGDMQKEIALARTHCDFLIVYFHWGIEYINDADGEQVEIAHKAIEAGASLVVGTHPHVLQGRELYGDTPIYYSTGNFVFDWQTPEGTNESVALQFTIGKKGIVSEKVIPVVIESCRPQIANGQKADQIIADLKKYSLLFEK